jgi:hypothetical protein
MPGLGAHEVLLLVALVLASPAVACGFYLFGGLRPLRVAPVRLPR